MRIIKSNELKSDFFSYKEFSKKDKKIVRKILNDVKKRGDEAIIEYTKKFDKISLKELKVSDKNIKKAFNKVNKETIKAIRDATKRIKTFAIKQKNSLSEFETKRDRILLGQKLIPIEKVGCYVPGGLYPLPSSALMTIIPAKIAGVKEIIVCSPKIKPVTIVAAKIAGCDRIYNVGGVQAIGGMAYGTNTILKVNKIVGPGNKYVNLAKKEVFAEVGIDFIAGPSEILIIADDSSNPEFIAGDILSQIEHSEEAKAFLLTTSEKISKKVNLELRNQLKNLKTRRISVKSLKNGAAIIVNNLNEAIEIANKIAPEHLEIQVKNPMKYINKFKNYGSMFIGNYSAEVFGDYTAGPNHTLPTNGAAKYTGGLSVFDFLKIVTYQKLSRSGVKKLGTTTKKLASIEGLDGHKKAAEIRMRQSITK